MQVRECMTKHVEVGSLQTSIKDAAKMMQAGDFGILPIADGDKLVGVVTDRDIVIRAVAEGMDPLKTRVSEVISHSVLYCFDDQDLDEVIQNLGDNQVRRLPVVNRDKRLVGILSLGDIAQAPEHKEHVDEALTRISAKNSSTDYSITF